MITIFRRLRKSLIESGSSRKYLLYAIGEIALVVIGILIALQINNWNQQRLESNLINVYLQNLKQDLNNDIEYFEFPISFHVARFYSLQHLLTLAGQPKLVLRDKEYVLPLSRSGIQMPGDNLNEWITKTFQLASRDYRIHLNSSSIEELKSTGIFSRIANQELKIGINSYYQNFNRTLGESQFEKVQRGIDQWNDSLIKDGVFAMDISNVQDPLDLFRNDPERTAILKSIIRSSRWIAISGDKAQGDAAKLIQLIEEELQKK